MRIILMLNEMAEVGIFILLTTLFVSYASGNCSGQGNCTKIANATFTEDYVVIKVAFNSSVKPKLPYSGCGSILEAASVTDLGRNPICSFGEQDNIFIYPDIWGTIQVGDSLIFKANSIVDSNDKLLAVGSVIISPEGVHQFQPVPVFTQYGHLSRCEKDRFLLSADLSYNSGYAHFVSFNWALEDVEMENASDATIYLKNIDANVSEIEVTSLILSANKSISVNISNVFGASEDSTFPLEVMSEPTVRIRGRRNVTVHQGIGYNFNADFVSTNCGPFSSKLSYAWRVEEIEGSGGDVLNKNYNSNSLYIVPFSLEKAVSYNVTVTVTYSLSDNSTGDISDLVTLHVLESPLVAQIVGGSREIGSSQTLVLLGKEISGRGGSLRFNWQCKDVSTGDACQAAGGSPITFDSSPKISLAITTGIFEIEKRYKFTLTVSENSKVAASSIHVKVKRSAVPIIEIRPECQFCDGGNELIFRGVIVSDRINASMKYTWNVFEFKGQEIPLQSSNGTLRTDVTHGNVTYVTTLKVPKNKLRNGYTYNVKLNATVSGGSSVSSEILQLHLPPRFGTFDVHPTQGIAFNTTFRVRTSGWIARDLVKPLVFRFGYMLGSKKRLLTGWQSSNILHETLFPEGDTQDGNKLTVFVEIKDKNWLRSESHVAVRVNRPQVDQKEHLVQYYATRLIEKNYAAISVAILGIAKGGLTNEAKVKHVDAYLGAIEKVISSPSLTFLLSETLYGLAAPSNVSGVVLSHHLKETIARLSVQLAKTFDEEKKIIRASQVEALLSIFDGIMPPQPELAFQNKTRILQAFENTSKIASELLCRSSDIEYQAKPLNTALTSISYGRGDFSNQVSSATFLLSKAFRGRYMQEKCSGTRHLDCLGYCLSIASYSHKVYLSTPNSHGDILTRVYQAILKDVNTGRNMNVTTNDKDFLFKIPITREYDENNFTVKCLMLDPVSSKWNNTYCHSQTSSVNGASMLQCACSKLYPLVGEKAAKPPVTTTAPVSTTATTLPSTTATTPASTPATDDIIMIVLDANCTKYTSTSQSKGRFLDDLRVEMAQKLKVSKSRIIIWNVACGSIIVNLTIANRNATQSGEPSKSDSMASLRGMLSSGLMTISLSDGNHLGAAAPGVPIRTTAPPTKATTRKPVIPDVTTNWMPMMLSFALALIIIIGIAAFIACLHGRYYKKNRFTNINCDRKKPKVEVPNTIETMNKKQRNEKLRSIMDESIERSALPSIIVPATMSLKKTRRKSKIGPANGSNSSQTSAASSRTTLQYSARDLPRLALDDTSSESEAETSFSEAHPRPKSGQSTKSRSRSAQPNSGGHQRSDSRTESRSMDYLTLSRAKSASSAGRERAVSYQSFA